MDASGVHLSNKCITTPYFASVEITSTTGNIDMLRWICYCYIRFLKCWEIAYSIVQTCGVVCGFRDTNEQSATRRPSFKNINEYAHIHMCKIVRCLDATLNKESRRIETRFQRLCSTSHHDTPEYIYICYIWFSVYRLTFICVISGYKNNDAIANYGERNRSVVVCNKKMPVYSTKQWSNSTSKSKL